MTPQDWNVDTVASVYCTMLQTATDTGTALPVVAVVGLERDVRSHAWLPITGQHPAETAAGLVLRYASQRPLWVCLCSDAYLSMAAPGVTPARGQASADWQAGAPAATEALVVTWVPLLGSPCTLVRPYRTADGLVYWNTDAAMDTRYMDGAVSGGDVPEVLAAALHAARAVHN